MPKSRGGAGRRGATIPNRGKSYDIGKIRWESNNPHDGQLMPNGDIHVGPKFFEWGQDTRVSILVHEAGHAIVDKTGDTNPTNFWKTGDLLTVGEGQFKYYGGEWRIEEAAAQAVADFALTPNEMPKRIRNWAAGVWRRSGYSPSSVVSQMATAAANIESGPAHAISTIWEWKYGKS